MMFPGWQVEIGAKCLILTFSVAPSFCLAGDIRGFWTQIGSRQEILFNDSGRPDSGTFDERYAENDSLGGTTMFQSCSGDWIYRNDTLYYRYTREIMRDSATWDELIFTSDTSWQSLPAVIGVDSLTGDTLMTWSWSNSVFRRANSDFTIPDVFPNSRIRTKSIVRNSREKYPGHPGGFVLHRNRIYLISGRKLPGFYAPAR